MVFGIYGAIFWWFAQHFDRYARQPVKLLAVAMVYTAVFCAGLVYLLGRPAEPRRVGRALLLMATAMLLHGIWDGRRTDGDRKTRTRHGFVLDAVSDLADALATDHGAQTPRVNFARSEVARLRDGRPPATE